MIDGFVGDTPSDPFAVTVTDVSVRDTEGNAAVRVSIEPDFARIYINTDYNTVLCSTFLGCAIL